MEAVSKLKNNGNEIKNTEDWSALCKKKKSTKLCKNFKTSEGHITVIVTDNAQFNLQDSSNSRACPQNKNP